MSRRRQAKPYHPNLQAYLDRDAALLPALPYPVVTSPQSPNAADRMKVGYCHQLQKDIYIRPKMITRGPIGNATVAVTFQPCLEDGHDVVGTADAPTPCNWKLELHKIQLDSPFEYDEKWHGNAQYSAVVRSGSHPKCIAMWREFILWVYEMRCPDSYEQVRDRIRKATGWQTDLEVEVGQEEYRDVNEEVDDELNHGVNDELNYGLNEDVNEDMDWEGDEEMDEEMDWELNEELNGEVYEGGNGAEDELFGGSVEGTDNDLNWETNEEAGGVDGELSVGSVGYTGGELNWGTNEEAGRAEDERFGGSAGPEERIEETLDAKRQQQYLQPDDDVSPFHLKPESGKLT